LSEPSIASHPLSLPTRRSSDLVRPSVAWTLPFPLSAVSTDARIIAGPAVKARGFARRSSDLPEFGWRDDAEADARVPGRPGASLARCSGSWAYSMRPSCRSRTGRGIVRRRDGRISKVSKSSGRFRPGGAHGLAAHEPPPSGGLDVGYALSLTLERLMAGALARPLGLVHLDEDDLCPATLPDGLVVVRLIESVIDPEVRPYQLHVCRLAARRAPGNTGIP